MFRSFVTHKLVVFAHYLIVLSWVIGSGAFAAFVFTREQETSDTDKIWSIVFVVVGTPLIWICTRIMAELIVVVFNIHDHLKEIRRKTK